MGIYKSGRPIKYNPHTKAGTAPPHKPGEYRIRNSLNIIDYLGETNDLKRRMNEHILTGKISYGDTIEYKIADNRSTSKTRRQHEQIKIKQHKPTKNKSKGGEGRIAKKSNLFGDLFDLF